MTATILKNINDDIDRCVGLIVCSDVVSEVVGKAVLIIEHPHDKACIFLVETVFEQARDRWILIVFDGTSEPVVAELPHDVLTLAKRVVALVSLAGPTFFGVHHELEDVVREIFISFNHVSKEVEHRGFIHVVLFRQARMLLVNTVLEQVVNCLTLGLVLGFDHSLQWRGVDSLHHMHGSLDRRHSVITFSCSARILLLDVLSQELVQPMIGVHHALRKRDVFVIDDVVEQLRDRVLSLV
jgi:hypothetical protein